MSNEPKKQISITLTEDQWRAISEAVRNENEVENLNPGQKAFLRRIMTKVLSNLSN